MTYEELVQDQKRIEEEKFMELVNKYGVDYKRVDRAYNRWIEKQPLVYDLLKTHGITIPA